MAISATLHPCFFRTAELNRTALPPIACSSLSSSSQCSVCSQLRRCGLFFAVLCVRLKLRLRSLAFNFFLSSSSPLFFALCAFVCPTVYLKVHCSLLSSASAEADSLSLSLSLSLPHFLDSISFPLRRGASTVMMRSALRHCVTAIIVGSLLALTVGSLRAIQYGEAASQFPGQLNTHSHRASTAAAAAAVRRTTAEHTFQ